MKYLIALVVALSLTGPTALSDETPDIPQSCALALQQGDWESCAKDAEPNSPIYLLAHANLGTRAYLEGDFGTAARHYDLSAPDGLNMFSDAFLQLYRSTTFVRVGRMDDAKRDVSVLLSQLETGQLGMGNRIPFSDDVLLQIYPTLISTLRELNMMEEMDSVVASYAVLPANDFYAIANKAAVFAEIGRYGEALPLSEKLIESHPEHPAILNNHCYLLTLMERGEDAVPFCQKAVAIEPDISSFQHSLAEAFAESHQCPEALAAKRRALELEPDNVSFQEPLTPCEN